MSISNVGLGNVYVNAEAALKTKDMAAHMGNEGTGAKAAQKDKADSYISGSASVYDEGAIKTFLKTAKEEQTARMSTLVEKVLNTQFQKYYAATGNSGGLKDYFTNLELDAETIAAAKNDISENGYWGVEQTSKRIFDFAVSLSGGDSEKLEEMRTAVEKGFKKAADLWGGTLPSISGQTHERVMQMFDEAKNKVSEI